jgi:hypothetical protein
MPRYFFHVLGGDLKSAVKDSEGTVFPGVQEARKEAMDFARDVVKHGFRETIQTWKIVVTDDNGAQILAIPLSQVRVRSNRILSELWSRFAGLKCSLGLRIFAWSIAAAMVIVVVQGSLRREAAIGDNRSYETVSTGQDAILAVRFASQASAADITKFLDSYNASVVGGPRPDGFYRLLIDEAFRSQKMLGQLVAQMKREKVVEFAAAMQFGSRSSPIIDSGY